MNKKDLCKSFQFISFYLLSTLTFTPQKNKKAKGKLSDHSAFISAQSDDEINLEDSVEGTGIANEEETNKE